jgi:bacteriorhodopsin
VRRVFGVLRVLAATAIIAAIVGQFAQSLSMVPDPAAFVVNFFWLIVVFPIVWVIYTMIRGPIVGWYPYPFLNPDIEPGVGYGGVTVYVIAIAAFILLVGAGIVGISRTAWPYRNAEAERSPEGDRAVTSPVG